MKGCLEMPKGVMPSRNRLKRTLYVTCNHASLLYVCHYTHTRKTHQCLSKSWVVICQEDGNVHEECVNALGHQEENTMHNPQIRSNDDSYTCKCTLQVETIDLQINFSLTHIYTTGKDDLRIIISFFTFPPCACTLSMYCIASMWSIPGSTPCSQTTVMPRVAASLPNSRNCGEG